MKNKRQTSLDADPLCLEMILERNKNRTLWLVHMNMALTFVHILHIEVNRWILRPSIKITIKSSKESKGHP